LKSEKVLIIFCRRLTDYSNKQRKGVHFSDIGPEIAELLRESGIEHCKICLVGSEGDKVEDVRSFFGLERVNELVRGGNAGDNVVYVMGAGHRSDLDRVLGEKEIQTTPDNHIFLL
jgi:uroporphyrinogen-III synthase